jgi:hypothetical protein
LLVSGAGSVVSDSLHSTAEAFFRYDAGNISVPDAVQELGRIGWSCWCHFTSQARAVILLSKLLGDVLEELEICKMLKRLYESNCKHAAKFDPTMVSFPSQFISLPLAHIFLAED